MTNRPALLIAAAAASLVAAPATSAPLERLGKPNGPSRPFSEAVRVGDIMFLSGQLGFASDGKLPPTIEGQARQTMDNIAATLAKAGLGWGDVAKCTVMLENMSDWPAFNTIYATYFPDGAYPARSAFGADGLALGALVEVECLARAPKRAK